MSFQHTYSVSECPYCGYSLTMQGAVDIEATNNEGQSLGMFPTRINECGVLENDAAGMIEAGFHAGTRCASCSSYLDEFED